MSSSPSASSETLRALAALMEPPGPELEPIAEALEFGVLPAPAEHVELFSFELPPFASIWLSPEGKLGGDARAWVGSFWRTLKEEPPKECDHLATLLSFYASLAELEEGEPEGSPRRERILASRRAFYAEHLESWLPVYLDRVQNVASHKHMEFYQTWSRVLIRLLAQEGHALALAPALPQHYERRPDLAVDLTVAELIALLLSPLASGLPLLRSDLRRCAADLSLVARHAERRYVLEQLLTQDAATVLAWLARFAHEWSERQRQLWPSPHDDFWSTRATATAELLTAMQAPPTPPIHPSAR